MTTTQSFIGIAVVKEEEEKINEVDEDKEKQKEVEEEEQEKVKLRMMGSKLSMHTLFLCICNLMLLNNNARFQMTMVYELLKRRFIFHNPEKKDEVFINYCGMPLFFGRREFAIVSGLKCHPPSELVPKFIVKKESWRRKKGGKEETRQSTEEQDLVSLVGISFKNFDLIYLLNVEDTSRKHKESLCLLWFVHNVLLAKDLNNISLKWVNLSQDIETFNNYHWGHESFELTVKYLLKPLGPKTNNLFGLSRAFMAWTFEVIPHLTHQVNAEEEISSPRILRWLR
ncbi:hypothetical protein KY284_001223 [Solanum tuberosum]|nr:hypothetical protein KY284_001223 [Solanum tuberosum]